MGDGTTQGDPPGASKKKKINAIVAVVNAQAITTVHGITTKTNGTHDDKDVSGEELLSLLSPCPLHSPLCPPSSRGKST